MTKTPFSYYKNLNHDPAPHFLRKVYFAIPPLGSFCSPVENGRLKLIFQNIAVLRWCLLTDQEIASGEKNNI